MIYEDTMQKLLEQYVCRFVLEEQKVEALRQVVRDLLLMLDERKVTGIIVDNANAVLKATGK